MKIAMVCPFFLPVVGGMEKHVFNLSKALIARGHEVTVLTSNIDHDGGKLPEKEDEIEGIRIVRHRTIARLGRFVSLWPSFAGELKNFDLIHVHNPRHPHAVLAAVSAKRKPLILTPHYPEYAAARGKRMQFLADLFDMLLMRKLLKKFGAIIALHEGERELLIRRGTEEEKIFVIPNGLEEEFFSAKTNGKKELKKRFKKIVLFVGRLHSSKGLDKLLQAFSGIAGKENGAGLIFVGPDGGYRNELERMAKEKRIEKSVVFAGEIKKKELIKYYDSCDVFVLPSKAEGFGIVLLEAMARGKPCIAMEAGGTKYVVDDGKTGFLVRSTEDMEKRLHYLLSNEREAERMGKNGGKKAQEYRWKTLVRNVEKAYGKAMKG